MPQTPAYNWFCVLYGAAEVLSHAAQYRAGQLAATSSAVAVARKRRGTTQETSRPTEAREERVDEAPKHPVPEGLEEKPTPIASSNVAPLEMPKLKSHVKHDPFLLVNGPLPTVLLDPPVDIVVEAIPDVLEPPVRTFWDISGSY